MFHCVFRYYSASGIELIRQKKDMEKPRKVLVHMQLWIRMLKKKDEILEAIKVPKEITFKLNEHGNRLLCVEQWENDLAWYVSFKAVGAKGVLPQFTMNFSIDEFTVMMDHVEDINAALSANRATGKRVYTGKDKGGQEQMLVYRWTWYLDDAVYKSGSYQYHTDADARDAADQFLAEDNGDQGRSLKLSVTSEFVEIWYPPTMTLACYFMLAWYFVQKMSSPTRCRGCDRRDRVLANHTCLDIPKDREVVAEKINSYVNAAVNGIKVAEFGKLIDEVRRRIGGSSIWCYLYAELCLFFVKPENVAEDMISFLSDADHPDVITCRHAMIKYLEMCVFSNVNAVCDKKP